MNPEGTVKLDSKKRIALGRYTEAGAGSFYRIVRLADGRLMLTPVAVVVTE